MNDIPNGHPKTEKEPTLRGYAPILKKDATSIHAVTY